MGWGGLTNRLMFTSLSENGMFHKGLLDILKLQTCYPTLYLFTVNSTATSASSFSLPVIFVTKWQRGGGRDGNEQMGEVRQEERELTGWETKRMHLRLSEGGACNQELSKQISPVSQHALEDKQPLASDCFHPYSPPTPQQSKTSQFQPVAAAPAAKVFGLPIHLLICSRSSV